MRGKRKRKPSSLTMTMTGCTVEVTINNEGKVENCVIYKDGCELVGDYTDAGGEVIYQFRPMGEKRDGL